MRSGAPRPTSSSAIARPHLVAAPAAVLQRGLYIQLRAEAVDEARAAEYGAHTAVAQPRQRIVSACADVDAVKRVPSCRGPIEACEDAQQRRLAGSGRPEQRHHLAPRDTQIDAVVGAAHEAIQRKQRCVHVYLSGLPSRRKDD